MKRILRYTRLFIVGINLAMAPAVQGADIAFDSSIQSNQAVLIKESSFIDRVKQLIKKHKTVTLSIAGTVVVVSAATIDHLFLNGAVRTALKNGLVAIMPFLPKETTKSKEINDQSWTTGQKVGAAVATAAGISGIVYTVKKGFRGKPQFPKPPHNNPMPNPNPKTESTPPSHGDNPKLDDSKQRNNQLVKHQPEPTLPAKYHNNRTKEELVYNQALDTFTLSSNYTEQELNKEYQRLVKKWHPDRNGNSIASIETMKKINALREILIKKLINKEKAVVVKKIDKKTNQLLKPGLISLVAAKIGGILYYVKKDNPKN